MSTQIILTKQIEALGAEGDAVTVADGYARNFLIPQGWAIQATAGNLKRIEALRKQQAARLAAEQEAAQAMAAKLAAHTCRISRAAGADNKLFGSITAADIAETLKAGGFDVDRRKIVLERPIRELGSFEVEVKMHAEATAKLKLEVIAASTAEAPAAAGKKTDKGSKRK